MKYGNMLNGYTDFVTYTPSKEKGMFNGEEITITATLAPDFESTVKLTKTKKTYKAEDLPGYAIKPEDITPEIKEKMINQAKDTITADCTHWAEGNSLKDIEYIGDYFLVGKEDFDPKPFNSIYCVFKITANITGIKIDSGSTDTVNEDESYYTYFNYNNIMILPDGTCSVDLTNGYMCRESANSDYGNYYWGELSPYGYSGYRELDSMFNNVVTSNISEYSYVSTVK